MSLELQSFIKGAGEGRNTMTVDVATLPALLGGEVKFEVVKANPNNGGKTYIVFRGPTGNNIRVRVKYEDDVLPTTETERDNFVLNQIRNYQIIAGVSDSTKYTGSKYMVFGKKAEASNLPAGSLADILAMNVVEGVK